MKSTSTSIANKTAQGSSLGQQQQRCGRVFLLVTAALTILAVSVPQGAAAFSTVALRRAQRKPQRFGVAAPGHRSNLLSATPVSEDDIEMSATVSFDDAVSIRYACTRYQRNDGEKDVPPEQKTASPPDPKVLELAREALGLSTRAPTGFNVQPYKLLLVESVAAKQAMSKYCIGRNRDRILDADCSVVFLADRQAMSSWKDYRSLLEDSSPRNRSKSFLSWLKLRALVALFSGGLPLPKIIAGPISFGMRLAMRVVSWLFRSWLVVPTLSSPECWSQKNTMFVAMTYMLACSARGLDTTPMEGYLSWGVRQSLGIPRRYTIPLIVSTGRAYTETKSEDDDAGISHGITADSATPRFPNEMVIYENGFP